VKWRSPAHYREVICGPSESPKAPICIDISRFFVELEAKGYKNFLKPEFFEMKTNEINLNTDDINRNQMQSDEIERNQPTQNIDENMRQIMMR
jgi:hypothetical protein